MIETFKESRRISTAEYCPKIKAPLDTHEMLLRNVQYEDQINHQGEPRPEAPEYVRPEIQKDKVGFINLFRSMLLELRP